MKKPTQKQVEKAKELLRQSGYFTQNLWQIHDVNSLLKDRDKPEFTLEEAIDFFDYVGNEHDASTGINWDSLNMYLDDYLEI